MTAVVAVPVVLKLSNDRKVSPLSKFAKAAQRWEPEVPNAFGLPAGPQGSCPGATDVCASVCYAARTERVFTSASRLVNHNLAALQACGDDIDAMAALLGDAVATFKAKAAKVSKLRGVDVPLVFRIHWDGDFFSTAYAQAWRKVILANADVQFWAYTRSFVPSCNVVPDLHDVPNLALYLSVDSANQAWAGVILGLYPTVKAAVMAETFDQGQEAMVALRGRRAPKCPENAQKVGLVNDSGQGACVTCGLCVEGRRDVLFSTTNK